ncbi:MAG: ABC transporter permease, partial [Firmicutes bacterium]|nr:ABC transporter permease [Bacillota bacterium]
QGKTAMGMFMMFVIMFVGNEMALLLEDKKLKTFTRAFTAPLKGYEMALGQLIANTLLGSLQILIFLFFTTVIFKVNWGVSIAYMFLILFIYMITAIGFAIGLAGIIKESEKYNMILMLIALVTSFLGGSFFPLENLNELINKISNFIPQRWVIDAFVKLSEGGTIFDIYTNILVLILFGLVLFTFGIKSLKPNLEDL